MEMQARTGYSTSVYIPDILNEVYKTLKIIIQNVYSTETKQIINNIVTGFL